MDLTTLSDLQIPHKPLAEQIADRINQMIIDQQLQPDDKLPTEVELMAYLDVGRSTIREALKILVARNIVEIRRGKGTFVTRNPGMSKDPLGFAYMQDKLKLAQDLLEVRARIEPWTAYLAAQRANEEDMEKLRAYCAKVVDMDEPYESHHAVDKAFHECIALCTHNQVIRNLTPIIIYSVEVFSDISRQTPLWSKTRISHQQMCDCICARDSVGASRAAMDHLEVNREFWAKSQIIRTDAAAIQKAYAIDPTDLQND